MRCQSEIASGLLCLALLFSARLESRDLGAFGGLEGWKLTLPYDTPSKGRPDEVSWPEIAGYEDERCFFTDAEGRLVFRARCDGVTTKGSKYPRTELRELAGQDEAAWDISAKQVRILELRFAVTHLPRVKPHVVCAQIHDADRDVLMIRLEGRRLLVERTGRGDVMLDREYVLGAEAKVRIEAGEGHVRVWYQDRIAAEWAEDAKGCYFKAGCYVQSNVAKGDAPEDFGEVRFERILRR